MYASMNDYYYHEQRRYAPAVSRLTPMVRKLILATTAVFAAQLLFDIPLGMGGPPGGLIHEVLAFQPTDFLHGLLWQPFTYLLLHAGLLHLFFNMLWLFFFGPDIEQALGTRQFLWFYIICGVVGVMATFVPMVLKGANPRVIGASGCVMGVMVAYAMVNPERQLYLFPFAFPLNARALVIILIALNVINGLQGGDTSVATHFGGMIAGYCYMKYASTILRWRLGTRLRGARPKKPGASSGTMDDLGKAVDNIFKFEDKKRRH